MKRDLAVAVVAVIVIGATCYALAVTRPPLPPTPSHPFSTVEPRTAVNARVVMRVNGEVVTQSEFEAAYKQLPEQMQQQFASEPGKMAFAEQLIRLKLLEQEARRLGLERDPGIAAQLAADRTNILANAAAEKMVAVPTDQAVQKFYAENKGRFESVDLSHIVIAYAGGSIPPRKGAPLTQERALKKAQAIHRQLEAGADFAATARKESDDSASGQLGGALGSIGRGMLPPELEGPVFDVPVGKFSEPIVSRFGIHIFKVNSRGSAPLEQLRAGISQRVRQQNMMDRVEVLRRTAKIDLDPKFFPDAKNWRGGKRSS